MLINVFPNFATVVGTQLVLKQIPPSGGCNFCSRGASFILNPPLGGCNFCSRRPSPVIEVITQLPPDLLISSGLSLSP